MSILFYFIYIFIYLFIYLFVYLFVYLFIYLFICLFIYLLGSYQVPRKLGALRNLSEDISEEVYVFYISLGFSFFCFLSVCLLPYNKTLMHSPLVGTRFIFTWWGALSGNLNPKP